MNHVEPNERQPDTQRALPPTRSALAPALHSLGDRRLNDMGLPSWAPDFVHHTVSLCKVLMDRDDDRHWGDRLDEHFSEDNDPTDLLLRLEALDTDWATAQIDALLSANKHRFWNKFLGQATYDRLKHALAEDLEAVITALRRGLELLRPFSVAMQDAMSILAPSDAERAGFGDAVRSGLLASLLSVDDYLEHVVDEISSRRFKFKPKAETNARTYDLPALVSEMRTNLTKESTQRLGTIDAALERKMKGARDALAYSADGPSQAANSLIEVIDRLLRASMNNADVVTWAETIYPGERTTLTYTPHGSNKAAPTKRAQVLYYLYGGRAITQTEPIIEAIALAFLNARDALQKVKHADSDYEAAAQDVEKSLTALAGALTLALRFRAITNGINNLDADQHALAG